jgi:hypothetical protein
MGVAGIWGEKKGGRYKEKLITGITYSYLRVRGSGMLLHSSRVTMNINCILYISKPKRKDFE